MGAFYNHSNLICPKCGSHNLVAISVASPMYEINEDGTPRRVIVDKYGIECINDSTSIDEVDVEYECLDCLSNFTTKDTDKGFAIGEEI